MFRPGDRVRCIGDWSFVTVGQEGTVVVYSGSVGIQKGDRFDYVHVEWDSRAYDAGHGFYCNRLELIDNKESFIPEDWS